MLLLPPLLVGLDLPPPFLCRKSAVILAFLLVHLFTVLASLASRSEKKRRCSRIACVHIRVRLAAVASVVQTVNKGQGPPHTHKTNLTNLWFLHTPKCPRGSTFKNRVFVTLTVTYIELLIPAATRARNTPKRLFAIRSLSVIWHASSHHHASINNDSTLSEPAIINSCLFVRWCPKPKVISTTKIWLVVADQSYILGHQLSLSFIPTWVYGPRRLRLPIFSSTKTQK